MPRRGRLVELVLRLVLPEAKAAALAGDLFEELDERPRRWPRTWVARQAAGIVAAAFRLSVQRRASALRLSVRDAMRALRRFPASTITAVAVLGLAMAAATLTFAFVDTVVFRHLPFPDDDRLIAPWFEGTDRLVQTQVSIPDFAAWRDGAPSLASIAAYQSGDGQIGAGLDHARVEVTAATASLFTTFGVALEMGRSFTSDRERKGSDDEVVISSTLWKTRFGGDPAIVGRTITLNGRVRTITGVAPADFEFPVDAPVRTDIWVPLVHTESDEHFAARHGRMTSVMVVARVRTDRSIQQAGAELSSATARLALEMPSVYRTLSLRVPRLRDSLTSRVRSWMLLALFAVTLVLLVAGVNVAHLLIARTTARGRDLAVRASLGASRAALVQSSVVESLALSLAAAVVGLVVGALVLSAIKAAMPDGIVRSGSTLIDARVVLAMLGIAVMSGGLSSLLPAWTASRFDIVALLKDGSATTMPAAARRRWRMSLLAGQSALMVVLLSVTTLLVGSFVRVVTTDLGFDRQHVIGLELPRVAPADAAARAVFPSRVETAVTAVPGVARVAWLGATSVPLTATGSSGTLLAPAASPDATVTTTMFRASPEYFDVAGIPLVSGRTFMAGETSGVAILDELAARQLFGEGAAAGGSVRWAGQVISIIGIAHNVRQDGAEVAAAPQVYVPLTSRLGARLVIRLSDDAEHVESAIVAAVRPLLEPGEDVPLVSPDKSWRALTADRRFSAGVMTALGLLALATGALGVFGITATNAAQERRDTGVRLLLGASRDAIFRRVLWTTGAPMLGGAVGGLGAAFLAARVFEAVLFEIKASDPIALLLPLALVLAAGAAAALAPAYRAARTEPLSVLRDA